MGKTQTVDNHCTPDDRSERVRLFNQQLFNRDRDESINADKFKEKLKQYFGLFKIDKNKFHLHYLNVNIIDFYASEL
jgi:hypothetical protein